jgi:hypothetical protein
MVVRAHGRRGERAQLDSGAELNASLDAVSDLGGRKTAAVLDQRFAFQTPLPAFGLTARDARTGAALWQRRFPLSPRVGFVQVMPARLGPDNQVGVLAFTFGVADHPDGSAKAIFRAIALSGVDGSELWKQRLVGAFSADGAETNVPDDFALVSPSSGDVAQNLLIGLETTNGSTGELTIDQAAGTDGTITTFGGTYSGHRAYPSIATVADLNADGSQDVVVAEPGRTGALSALDGATQNQIWSIAANVHPYPDIESLTGFSSKTVPDITVSNFGGRQYVLAGTDGSVVVSKHADLLVPVGHAGAKLQPAVQFVKFLDVFRSHRVGAGVVINTVNASGATIYKKRLGAFVTPPKHANGGSDEVGFGPAGDVQPDGSLDSFIDAAVEANSFTHLVHDRRRGIVDGRTGAFHALPTLGAIADGSLHRGKGTDILGYHIVKHELFVSGWDGLSGKRLYRHRIHAVTDVGAVFGDGARVTGHQCSDQLVVASSKARGFSGVLAGNGRPVWSVRYSPARAVGGTVTPNKSLKDFCA